MLFAISSKNVVCWLNSTILNNDKNNQFLEVNIQKKGGFLGGAWPDKRCDLQVQGSVIQFRHLIAAFPV